MREAVERRASLESEVDEVISQCTRAIKSKALQLGVQISEGEKRLTELELSKMDIDTSLRERLRNCRSNAAQLETFRMSVYAGGDTDVFNLLEVEQQSLREVSQQLAEDSRSATAAAVEQRRAREQILDEQQALRSLVALNVALHREKPRVERPKP